MAVVPRTQKHFSEANYFDFLFLNQNDSYFITIWRWRSPVSNVWGTHCQLLSSCVWAAWNKLLVPECLHLWQPANRPEYSQNCISGSAYGSQFSQQTKAWAVRWLRGPAHHEVKLKGWKSHRKVRKDGDSQGHPLDCLGYQARGFSSIQQPQLRRNTATGSKPFLCPVRRVWGSLLWIHFIVCLTQVW